jgi:hypothetical protein
MGGCANLAGAARGEVGSVVDGVVAAGLATWGERRRVGGAVFSWWCGCGRGDGVRFERGEVKGYGFERGEMKGKRPSYVLLKFLGTSFSPENLSF